MNSLTELESFHHFVSDKLASGSRDLTPEEALHLWRELSAEAERSEIDAIREGLAAIEAGRTKPLAEFVESFKTRHGLSGDGT